MLKKLAQLISILMMLAQLSPVFASSEISAKKFIACEKSFLKHQRISIAIDKEQKQAEPDLEKISSMQSNITRLERITDKYCTDYTAQASY